jgi:hypothetical protein
VAQQLEDEGVAKFGEALGTLMAKLRGKPTATLGRPADHPALHPE